MLTRLARGKTADPIGELLKCGKLTRKHNRSILWSVRRPTGVPRV